MPTAWKVVTAIPATGQDASQRWVQGMTVTLQTPAGHTTNVFVPSQAVGTDQAKAMLQEAADKLDSLINLSSGG